MKAIDINELKAHLSNSPLIASRGNRIVVHDRDEPIAQLGPLPSDVQSWRTHLQAQAGRLRTGPQKWERLRISKLKRRIDVRARSGPCARPSR